MKTEQGETSPFSDKLNTGDRINFLLFQKGLLNFTASNPDLQFEAVSYRDRKTHELKYKVKVRLEEGMKRNDMAGRFSSVMEQSFSGYKEWMPEIKFVGSRRFDVNIQGHSVVDKPNRWALTLGEPMHYVKTAQEQARGAKVLPESDMTITEPLELIPSREDEVLGQVTDLSKFKRRFRYPRYAAAGTAAGLLIGVGVAWHNGYLDSPARTIADIASGLFSAPQAVSAADCRRINVNIDSVPPVLVDGRVKPGPIPSWLQELREKCLPKAEASYPTAIASIQATPDWAATATEMDVANRPAEVRPAQNRSESVPTIPVAPKETLPLPTATPKPTEEIKPALTQTPEAEIEQVKEPDSDRIFEDFLDRLLTIERGQTVSGVLEREWPQELLSSETPNGWIIDGRGRPITQKGFGTSYIVVQAQDNFKRGEISINPDEVSANTVLTGRQLLKTDEAIKGAKSVALAPTAEEALQFLIPRR